MQLTQLTGGLEVFVRECECVAGGWGGCMYIRVSADIGVHGIIQRPVNHVSCPVQPLSIIFSCDKVFH